MVTPDTLELPLEALMLNAPTIEAASVAALLEVLLLPHNFHAKSRAAVTISTAQAAARAVLDNAHPTRPITADLSAGVGTGVMVTFDAPASGGVNVTANGVAYDYSGDSQMSIIDPSIDPASIKDPTKSLIPAFIDERTDYTDADGVHQVRRAGGVGRAGRVRHVIASYAHRLCLNFVEMLTYIDRALPTPGTHASGLAEAADVGGRRPRHHLHERQRHPSCRPGGGRLGGHHEGAGKWYGGSGGGGERGGNGRVQRNSDCEECVGGVSGRGWRRSGARHGWLQVRRSVRSVGRIVRGRARINKWLDGVGYGWGEAPRTCHFATTCTAPHDVELNGHGPDHSPRAGKV